MMIFLMLFVFLEILPTLEPILVDVTLPLLTRILMGISHFLYAYRYFLPVAAVMILVGWKILTERVWFRYSYDRVICKFPVVGRQIRIICTARFCENMSSLYSSWTSDHILPEIYGRNDRKQVSGPGDQDDHGACEQRNAFE